MGLHIPTYDANGNFLAMAINSYIWNSRNQLASMNSGGAAFSYDSFGRRVVKSIAGNAKAFLYDGANSVQELQGTNPTANLLTGGIDEVFLRTDSGGTANFLADALGTTLALSDSSGTIQTQYTYEPFGKTTVAGAASGNVNAFTGRELDETGLYFYRARYYSPQIGRFISEDPIAFDGGPNIYTYADNDPINSVDELGLSPRPVPRSRAKTRPCKSDEYSECAAICHAEGKAVQACFVSQTFRVTRALGGLIKEEWKDSPGQLDCRCTEPKDECFKANQQMKPADPMTAKDVKELFIGVGTGITLGLVPQLAPEVIPLLKPALGH